MAGGDPYIVRRLLPLSLAALVFLASCAPSAPSHDQDPFYLAPPVGRQQTSPSSPDVRPHHGGGVTPGGLSDPVDGRSNTGLPPTGGSMSIGGGGS